jgi:hypothetical protein
MQRAQLSVCPAAARALARPVRMLQARTRTRAVRSRAWPNYVPAERRAGLHATQLALAIGTSKRAPPRLFC